MERARRKNDIQVSNIKNLYKVLEVVSVSRTLQRVISPVPLRDHKSSFQERTPVLAVGFLLEGNLCHFDKLHEITQLEISHVPREIKRAKYTKGLLAGRSIVLVDAV